MTADNYQPTFTLSHKIQAALGIVGAILLVGWLLKYSAYGFDFTDESFYLLWMDTPHKYSWPASQFGFIYHPLYSITGGEIPAIRRINILITFGLACCLCYVFLAQLTPSFKTRKIIMSIISAGLASSVLIAFQSGLITPNYNTLNLQALLVAATGLLLAEKSVHRSSVAGWLLIGVGGWLAFMAKPTTALVFGISVAIYLILARRLYIRMLTLSVTCALVLLLGTALLLDGSITGFIRRLQVGVEFSMLQGGGYTPSELIRIDGFSLGSRNRNTCLMVGGALLLGLYSSWKNKPAVTLCISIAFFTLTALITLGQIDRTARLGPYQGLLIFSIIYAVIIAALVFGRLQALKTISSQQWAIAGLFLITPHIYAAGTNGNYWSQGSSAAIFWLLAGLTLIGPIIRERASWLLLPVSIAVQAVTATLIQTGFEEPYRQPQPLRLYSATMEVGPKKSQLVLQQGYADYISSAIAVGKGAGLEPKTPMIDLTGQSPGILFVLEAESVGQAWIIGGYPGSVNFTKAALDHTSCEKISTAWILLEPNGSRSITTDVMLSAGIEFSNSYIWVGRWETAEGAGGYKKRRTQELYKPIDPRSMLTNCLKLRLTNKTGSATLP